MVLSTRFVEMAKPKRGAGGELVRAEYPDAACPGLYLVIQPSGTRSWAFRFHRNGKTGKVTLGSAGEGGLPLSAARAAAASHRHRLEQGIVTPVTLVTPSAGGGEDGIETAVASFLELHVRRKNRATTARAAEGIFNNIVLPAWRGRTIGSIRRRDVIDLVESVAARGHGYRANRTLAAVGKFFAWCVARDMLTVSPAAGVEPPHVEKVRDRVLSDEELRALWLACEGDDAFSAAVRILISTGARLSEVGRMEFSELDAEKRIWTLPARRTKNAREHKIPLSSQAWAAIAARPRFANCPYVFSTNAKGPVHNWAKAKTRISNKAGLEETGWRLHDLRRTCASGMQRLGVSVPVIEKALNHVSGTFRGIVGVYQQHDYEDEIRIALQRWSYHIEQIVGGQPAKIVKLRQR